MILASKAIGRIAVFPFFSRFKKNLGLILYKKLDHIIVESNFFGAQPLLNSAS